MSSKYDNADWIGVRKGHLVVQKYVGSGRLECKCDCGRVVNVKGYHLENNYQQTCGKQCKYHSVLTTKHGLSNDRLYRIWKCMKRRCYDPKSKGYDTYGGRGIIVCDEWRNDLFVFRDWALSNGYSDDLSIDRIDNDKGYSPENCRWATSKEQRANQNPRWTFCEKTPYHKKKLKTWTIDGVTKPITEWCKEYGMTTQSVTYRVVTKGMSPKEALMTPKQQGSHKFEVGTNCPHLESAEQRGIIK